MNQTLITDGTKGRIRMRLWGRSNQLLVGPGQQPDQTPGEESGPRWAIPGRRSAVLPRPGRKSHPEATPRAKGSKGRRLLVGLALAALTFAWTLSASPANAAVDSGNGGGGAVRVDCDANVELITVWTSMTSQQIYYWQNLAVRVWLYSYLTGTWETRGWIYSRPNAANQLWERGDDIFRRDGKISRYVVYVEYAWQQPNGTWTVRAEYPDRYYQQNGYFSSPQATCYA